LITINIRNARPYTIPVPMSVEFGPYGPPNPSGTAHMIKLRKRPETYVILRIRPKIKPIATASSATP